MDPVMKESTGQTPFCRMRSHIATLLAMICFALITTAAFAQHVANPFVGATQYLNPDYTAEVNSALPSASTPTLAAQMKVVESYPTAVWMDRIAAITGGTGNNGRLGLAQHITTALSQQVGSQPVIVTLVIYDLPDRDCAALASNGEISINGNGTLTGIQQYEQDYITPIYNILQPYANNPNLRFVLIIEPDSLPNLVTNTGMGAAPIANCVAANGGVSGGASLTGVYVQGVQYALNTFHPLTNVYQYLDIGQSAWLGWPNNLQPAIQLYNGLVKGTTAGYESVDGFISNTSNYVPTKEPFLTASQQVGGNPVDSATFYQYDPEIDELDYDQAFYAAATSAGFPATIGFLIDTSRNGWGGPLRPTAPSTATDINTFVNESKIDERGVRGVWCNIQASGIGEPPAANPGGFANLEAYIWIKPPGESDGTYPGSTYGGVTSTTGDPNCNPANSNPLAGGPTDSLPNSPPAGTFWATEFAMDVQNAYPAIPTSVTTGFTISATAVTVAPGATANSTVTIADTGGFSGAVDLTISGLPAGVTAAFTPPSVSGAGSSVLAFTASSTAAEGTSNLTITGTSGTVTETATVVLTVGSGSTGSPALSVASAALSLAQGATVTDSVTVTGFSGNTTLSASGLPPGVTAVFTPQSVNGSGSSTLTFSASGAAAAGASTITVTGAAGNITATATIALTLTGEATSAPALSVSSPSLTLNQGSAITDTITVTGFSGNATLSASGLPAGVTAGFNPSSVNGTGSSTLTLTASSTAAGGAATVTITGALGNVTATATIVLTVANVTVSAPAISVASTNLSVSQGSSVTDNIALTGFSGSATLSASDLPAGVTAVFTTNPAASSSVVQFSAGNSATAGPATVLLTASSGSQTASVYIQVSIVVPSFSMSASPGNLTVAQGASTTATISVTGLSGFTGNVTLTSAITSSPSGAVELPTMSFNPTNPVSITSNAAATATLTIVTAASSSPGCVASRQMPNGISWPFKGGVILAGLFLFFLPKRSRAWRSMLSLLLLLIVLADGAIACGGGSGGRACPNVIAAGTTPGTYVITVTGASGGVTETGTVNLTVQ